MGRGREGAAVPVAPVVGPGPPERRRGSWLAVGATLALLLLALLTRTTGIHGDENDYVHWAREARLGDSRTSGKPPLFYLVNHAGFHAVGALLGPLRPLAPYLVYAVACSLSLGWLVRRVSLSPRRRAALWALLAASPLFVLNATQVMAEAPVLALLTALFGLAALPGSSRRARWAEAGCVIAAILFKESAIPAVATLAIASLCASPRRAVRLSMWIAVALGVAWGVRAVLRVPPQAYGGVGHWSAWWERAPLLSTYLWLWVFLVGPLMIAAMVVGGLGFLRGHGRRAPVAESAGRLDTFLFACSAASLLLTLGVCLTSNLAFARYAYPTIWIGVLAAATWVIRWARATWLPALVAGARPHAEHVDARGPPVRPVAGLRHP